MRVLMTTLAQGNAGIGIILPDMVCRAGAGLVAYAARQFLYPLDMQFLFDGVGLVHAVTLPFCILKRFKSLSRTSFVI